MIDRIRERRAALAAQLEQAKQQYDQLEQTKLLLDRQMCAMQGGIQELDALLVRGEDADEHGATREHDHQADSGDDQNQGNSHDILPAAHE